MSNRQDRRARKQRQRAGIEVYVHVKPTRRRLLALETLAARHSRSVYARVTPISNRTERRLHRLYGEAS